MIFFTSEQVLDLRLNLHSDSHICIQGVTINQQIKGTYKIKIVFYLLARERRETFTQKYMFKYAISFIPM